MDKDENSIQIRQATVKDTLMIEAFYLLAFPGISSLKYPSRWNWLYLQNPFCKPSGILPLWIAIYKDRVVGMAGTMQSPFQINETIINAAWGCDFRVLSDLRGKGIGTALEKARMAFDFFSLQMSKVSRLVKINAGGVPGRTATGFLHVKRFEPSLLFEELFRYFHIKAPKTSVVYRIGLKLGVHKLISVLITFIFNFYPKKKLTLFKKTTATNLEYKTVDCFDEKATLLWENIRQKYSLAVRRDSSYLNWKFVQQPHINYQRFVVLDKGELCGILIFRIGKEPEIPVGIISEVYTDKSRAVLKEMLAFAVKSLYDQGAQMIKCASSSKELSKILTHLGFRPYQYYVPLFLLKDNKFFLQKQALSGEWLLSLGDQDLDEYPHASQPSLKQIVQIIFGNITGYENLPTKDYPEVY